MASVNTEHSKLKPVRVPRADKLKELERMMFTCFLWENSFYESGSEMATRAAELIPQLTTAEMTAMVRRVRFDMHIRHAPLFLIVEMIKDPKHRVGIGKLIEEILQRPDDATELMALYLKDGPKPLAKQLKLGLARGLTKFTEYQLSKYKSKGEIKLVDVFNMVHPKPFSKHQEKYFKKLMTGKLAPADTWEVEISKNGNNADSWNRLLNEEKLGGLALLRNLRNMNQVGVSDLKIKKALEEARFDRTLPFRFIAAARHAPRFESVLENRMLENSKNWGLLSGHTILLVDVSGSMDDKLSDKSEITRLDAACGLAMIMRETCESLQVFTFSNQVIEVPTRRGFALRDVIVKSQSHGGTLLGAAVTALQSRIKADRLIVFTDEQSHDVVPKPAYDKAYMINVAGYKKSVATTDWISISGFSENVSDFIQMTEKL